ncbi:MAG: MATE family efflux transporter [Prevotella sp.]|nr:MATE family efflux transporter [Prevotella sp.]
MHINEIDRNIGRLALPMVVANATVPLLGLVDLAIVGHMDSPDFIATVAVGSMMFNVMYWLLGFLRMTTSGLTAQAFGAGDWAQTRRMFAVQLRQALLTALALVLLQQPLLRVLMLLFSVDGSVSGQVSLYFHICIWGAPAVLALYVMTGWCVGMQNTRVAMTVSVVQNLLNILLSLLFVYALGWGLRGVALGTLAAQWMGCGLAAVMSWRLRRVGNGTSDAGTDVSRGREQASESPVRMNVHLFLRTICLVAVNLFFTSMGSRQGSMMLAVNTLLMTLFTLFSYVMDGIAFAGEALCGRYWGASEYRLLGETIRRLFIWGMLLVVLFTLLYIGGGQSFLRLLTDNAGVTEAARPYFWWAVAVPLCGMAAFVCDGVFVGLGFSGGMLVSSALATAVFFSVSLLLFGRYGNHSLWLALLLYLFLRGLVQVVWFLRWRKTGLRTQKISAE